VSGRERLLLVVDDEPFVGRVVRVVLADAGIARVKSVGTAQAMWEALKTERPDVILLDVMLPDANGMALLRTLRSVEQWAGIPVVIMTGIADIQADRESLSQASAIIAKPIAPRALTTCVLQALAA